MDEALVDALIQAAKTVAQGVVALSQRSTRCG
jgi:hypothetical protein